MIGAPPLQIRQRLDALNGRGLEIGGPSPVFGAGGELPVYALAACVDNVTFGNETRWEGAVEAGLNFRFHPGKQPGRQHVLEGEDLSSLAEASYDFLLSSHMLEHTANPLGALRKWERVLKDGGHLLLVLPHKDGTFDHRRPVTSTTHLLSDEAEQTGEDDATHFAEIFALRDLHRDPEQASRGAFEAWILANHINRGAHHHVFDSHAVVAMLDAAKFQIEAAEAAMPFHVVVLARKPAADVQVNNQAFLSPDADVYTRSPFPSDRRQSGSRARR